MDGLVATGAPAGAAHDKTPVLNPANEQTAGGGLLLEMALEAEGLIALSQHLVIDRPMHSVAAGAAFPHRFVLEDKRAALGLVAAAAGVVELGEGAAHATHTGSFMRIVAIAAADAAFWNGVMEREIKLAALVEVAIKANLRGAARVDDVAPPAPSIDVDAAGTVARFATDFEGIGPFGAQEGVIGGFEWLGDGLVTLGAGFGSDKLCSRNLGRDDQSLFGAHAGDEHQAGEQAGQSESCPRPVRTEEREGVGKAVQSQFHRVMDASRLSRNRVRARQCIKTNATAANNTKSRTLCRLRSTLAERTIRCSLAAGNRRFYAPVA